MIVVGSIIFSSVIGIYIVVQNGQQQSKHNNEKNKFVFFADKYAPMYIFDFKANPVPAGLREEMEAERLAELTGVNINLARLVVYAAENASEETRIFLVRFLLRFVQVQFELGLDLWTHKRKKNFNFQVHFELSFDLWTKQQK